LRFLVLMSKVMQNLGFGVEFEKEKYMTDLNDFISNNKAPMNTWLDEVSGGTDDTRSRNYSPVVITDIVKLNSLKWLYSAMYQNRQVLRRELAKKMDDVAWEEALSQLEGMGIFGAGGSSDSWTTSGTEAELTDKRDTAASNTAGNEDDREAETDTELVS